MKIKDILYIVLTIYVLLLIWNLLNWIGVILIILCIILGIIIIISPKKTKKERKETMVNLWMFLTDYGIKPKYLKLQKQIVDVVNVKIPTATSEKEPGLVVVITQEENRFSLSIISTYSRISSFNDHWTKSFNLVNRDELDWSKVVYLFCVFNEGSYEPQKFSPIEENCIPFYKVAIRTSPDEERFHGWFENEYAD